ncbi:hypothetical protein TNCV_2290181 [Trichonephila clavipes]|uniref:Uncharacterized protein n=1 Tax=Trichonephila clavipes TaxID=2585209 RepID=A0A8X6RP06_TRICX|nr:hypothetical protein TNCV_2290181 [Trichonephila clavipes]
MIGQRSVDAQSKITLDGTKLEDNTHVHVEPISSGFRSQAHGQEGGTRVQVLIPPKTRRVEGLMHVKSDVAQSPPIGVEQIFWSGGSSSSDAFLVT